MLKHKLLFESFRLEFTELKASFVNFAAGCVWIVVENENINANKCLSRLLTELGLILVIFNKYSGNSLCYKYHLL